MLLHKKSYNKCDLILIIFSIFFFTMCILLYILDFIFLFYYNYFIIILSKLLLSIQYNVFILIVMFYCVHMGALQALIGHQYGTARLPVQVEVSEFQLLLLRQSQEAGVSSKELERVYRREENTVPPSYCLRPPHRSTGSPQVTTKNYYLPH